MTMTTSQPAVVLGVDDTPENLISLGHLLGDDFEFCVATSGREALDILATKTPDVVLLDVMMPDMDGFEVCRAMKSDPRLHDIPVIFITALNDIESENRGLALGAVDFIKKPFHPELARQRIINHLERERLRRQVMQHNEELEWQVRERTLGLRIAKEAAEAANQLKTTILRNMSHEFRTPLNGVLGMLSLARDRCVDPKLRSYLEKGAIAGERLHVVLKNFLDLAASENGVISIEQRPFVIGSLFADLHRMHRGAAEAKGLTLGVESLPPDQASLRVLGDAARIAQIIHELVGNAIKFSERGCVRIQASLTALRPEACNLRVAVSDQGVGIAPADLARIFTPFLQLDGSETRRHGGNGIGLGLSEKLAHLMGGALTAESEPGKGSTFILELPLARVGAEAERQAARGDLRAYLREQFPEASLLIVDDDPVTLDYLHEIAAGAGMSVVSVSSGEAALESARTAQFDVVLLDLMLPGVSGLEVGRAIRRLPGYARTPLIALTARTSQQAQEDSFHAGFDRHVSKPVTPDILLEVLADALERVHEKVACPG